MQMVGHQNEFAQKQFGTHFERFEKFVINDLPPIVKHHFTVHNFPEQPLAIGGDDGDLIMPIAGIIPSPQAIRRYSVFVFEFFWHIQIISGLSLTQMLIQ